MVLEEELDDASYAEPAAKRQRRDDSSSSSSSSSPSSSSASAPTSALAQLHQQQDHMQVVKQEHEMEVRKARTQAEEAQEQLLCAVCFVNRRDCLYLPCMHLATCGDCDEELKARNQTCPMCQGEIQTRYHDVNIAV